jgi:hypothetical protein
VDILNKLFSWPMIGLAFGLLALVVGFMIYARRHDSFGLNDFFYTFPIVGRLARYSKDYSESHSGAAWLNVENTLCRDYAKHCAAASREEFDNNIQYLKLTYDHGRREMPMWVMWLLAVLVVLEGLGFSYLLGGFMAMEGSENTRQLLMVAIVVVLATILVWVTHHAGHQWFRTSLLRHCFREYQKDKTNPNRAFTTCIVSLDEDQNVDAHDPPHVRCANRVVSKPGDLGSHAWVWIAGVLIFTIAVGSTVLRLEAMHSSEIEQAQALAAPAAAAAAPADGLSPELQAALGQTPNAAAPAAATPTDAAAAAKEHAALAGFVMLAIIFVVTQLVGVGVGLRYGFAGKQSRQAHRATHGAADYATYFAPVERRMLVANARLLKLHQMLEKHSPTPIDFKKTFLDFVDEEQKRGASYLQKPPAPRFAPKPKKNGHDTTADALAADDMTNFAPVSAPPPEAPREEGLQ